MDWRIVMMGVSGSGNSSVGEALACQMGSECLESDAPHPEEDIAKMPARTPLGDADRWPWLDLVAAELVACVADHRMLRPENVSTMIASGKGVGWPVLFIHLVGSPELIAPRLAGRPCHFMPAAILDSQFASLEPPAQDEWHMSIDIDQPLAAMVDQIRRGMADGEGPDQGQRANK